MIMASVTINLSFTKYYKRKGENKMERIIEKKEDIIHDVVSIITTMSFKAGTNKVKQTTLEGKIVQDADY